MQERNGFTLIELMIVVAIIAILASIAIPNLLSSRLRANEAAAVSMLRAISTAQTRCQTSLSIDLNRNGAGEYGFLAELGSRVRLRDSAGNQTGEFLAPPLLQMSNGEQVTYSGGSIANGGAIQRSGYYFAVFLPSSTYDFVPEAATGGASTSNNPDAEAAEQIWCAYAWPVSRNATGSRVFFVNQRGEILAAPNDTGTSAYSGTTRGPRPDAAFLLGSSGMASTVASNVTGNDDQRWVVIN